MAQKSPLHHLSHDVYTKIRSIGSGNFGNAQLVRSEINQQQYIIKKIKKTGDKKQYSNICNEVTAMKKIRHPYVISYKESFEQKKNICIVMEYARGGDLHNRILEQKKTRELFDQQQILEWFIQLCLGLKYIHEHRIVHRDFKSENIFLTDKGLCKIGDFGICKMMKQTDDLAQTKIGTPYCMAPQIWDGKSYNQKSDIWSLGCVLYQLCTLQYPFSGQNNVSLYVNILNGHPQRKVSSKYSQDLRNMISELINKQPHKRPSVCAILQKQFIKKRKKNIFSKSMNISYQQSLQLSQRLNKHKQTKQPVTFKARSLSLPALSVQNKSTNKKFIKPKVKLAEYKQAFPIIQQQNKSLKQQLQQVTKQRDQHEEKLKKTLQQINELLQDDFSSIQQLKEVIKMKLGYY